MCVSLCLCVSVCVVGVTSHLLHLTCQSAVLGAPWWSGNNPPPTHTHPPPSLLLPPAPTHTLTSRPASCLSVQPMLLGGCGRALGRLLPRRARVFFLSFPIFLKDVSEVREAAEPDKRLDFSLQDGFFPLLSPLDATL